MTHELFDLQIKQFLFAQELKRVRIEKDNFNMERFIITAEEDILYSPLGWGEKIEKGMPLLAGTVDGGGCTASFFELGP